MGLRVPGGGGGGMGTRIGYGTDPVVRRGDERRRRPSARCAAPQSSANLDPPRSSGRTRPTLSSRPPLEIPQSAIGNPHLNSDAPERFQQPRVHGRITGRNVVVIHYVLVPVQLV